MDGSSGNLGPAVSPHLRLFVGRKGQSAAVFRESKALKVHQAYLDLQEQREAREVLEDQVNEEPLDDRY